MAIKLWSLVVIAICLVNSAKAKYTSVSKKIPDHNLRDDDNELVQGAQFYIPSYQCNAFLDQSMLCGPSQDCKAMKVTVSDHTRFPAIHIENSLANVSIIRAPNDSGRCMMDAHVDVEVQCKSRPQIVKNAQNYRLPLPKLSGDAISINSGFGSGPIAVNSGR